MIFQIPHQGFGFGGRFSSKDEVGLVDVFEQVWNDVVQILVVKIFLVI